MADERGKLEIIVAFFTHSWYSEVIIYIRKKESFSFFLGRFLGREHVFFLFSWLLSVVLFYLGQECFFFLFFLTVIVCSFFSCLLLVFFFFSFSWSLSRPKGCFLVFFYEFPTQSWKYTNFFAEFPKNFLTYILP